MLDVQDDRLDRLAMRTRHSSRAEQDWTADAHADANQAHSSRAYPLRVAAGLRLAPALKQYGAEGAKRHLRVGWREELEPPLCRARSGLFPLGHVETSKPDLFVVQTWAMKLEDDLPESIFPQAFPIMCFSSRGDALLHRCNSFRKAGSCNLALCNLTLCNLALCHLALCHLALWLCTTWLCATWLCVTWLYVT